MEDKSIKMYFMGGKGIENPKDANGEEIKEGSIITFEWFDCEDPVEDMRRKFGFMKEWSEERIYNKIHSPSFIVKRNKKGFLFGEGIEPPRNSYSGRLYLHDFRFKYTKLIS